MEDISNKDIKQLKDLISKTEKAKKKRRFSKKVVVSVIVLNILFAAAVLYVFLRTGNEPTALVAAWFAFTSGELWLLAGIKKNKNKEDGVDNE